MKRLKYAAALMVLLVLAACGGPHKDVQVFVMPDRGLDVGKLNDVTDQLQKDIGPSPTVKIVSSSLFNIQKFIVELAAGGNDILIVPKDVFLNYGKLGGFVKLDDVASPDQYPDGVVEVQKDDKSPVTKQFIGIPMKDSKWLKQAKYAGDEIYAFIPENSKHQAKAKQALKTMAER